MAKNIKYGKVELGPENFDEKNAIALISIRLPLQMIKELKKLSLTEDHGGKYQLLIRDILSAYIAKHSKKKKAS